MNKYDDSSQDTNDPRVAEVFKIKLRIYIQLTAIATLILAIGIGFFMMINNIFFLQARDDRAHIVI